MTKALRGLCFGSELPALPAKGDKIFAGEKEVGYVVSAVRSPRLQANIGFGYVRREHNKIGSELEVRSAAGNSTARVVELPFVA